MAKVCVVGDPLTTHPGVIESGGVSKATVGGVELALDTYQISTHTYNSSTHGGAHISSGGHRTTCNGLCIALEGDATTCGDTIKHAGSGKTTCAS